MTALAFVVPADLERPTGGNRYDVALAAALARLGVDVDLRRVPGRWPDAGPRARAALGRSLTGPGPVLVDGLLACGAPDEVAAAHGPVHVLVHMPLGLDVGLSPAVAADRDAREGSTLRAAAGVLTTSGWTAAELRRRHGLDGVTVATPGADPAPLATGSDPPRLLHLAAVTPVKNQLTLVAALARLADRPWTARLVGALDADPGYVADVRRAVRENGLTGRVLLTGLRTGADLERTWAATDVLLLPSRAETWGLVVTEALARGVPALVGRGTGAEEALGATPDGRVPGVAADPSSPDALVHALREMLGARRESDRTAALERRRALPGWDVTAATVRGALAGVPV